MNRGARYHRLFQEKGFPQVGDMVRCRSTGDPWRVLQREVWRRLEANSVNWKAVITPTFYFLIWRMQEGVPMGVGDLRGCLYTLEDNGFAQDWDQN